MSPHLHQLSSSLAHFDMVLVRGRESEAMQELRVIGCEVCWW